MYCTVFNKDYLTRGITMLQSLFEQDSDAEVSVLCLDLETVIAVKEIRNGQGISVMELKDLDHELIEKIRAGRDFREFCWSLGAILCDHHLRHGVDEVVYLDADLLFLGDPQPLLDEARKGDLAAIKHRFPDRLKHYELNGVFNVQWVYFANSDIGRKAASRWASQCIDCCSYLPEQGIVGDQKYLDEWPDLYPTFVDIQNLGAGVAPWNHEALRPHFDHGQWKVISDEDLIFYHFHGLKILDDGGIELAGPIYSSESELPLDLYQFYIDRLAVTTRLFPNLIQSPSPEKWFIRRNRSWLRRLLAALGQRLS